MAEVRDLLRTAAPSPAAPLDADAVIALAAARSRRRRRRLAAWVLGVLGVVGIGVPLRNAIVPAGSPDADADAERVRTVRPAPQWRIEPLAEVAVDAESVEGVAVWGDYLAYLSDGTSVAVVDVPTGAVRTVARPTLAGGMFTAVAGDGEWVVFTEINGPTNELTPGDAGRSWRVAAVDLRTGREREIRRGGRRDPYGVLPGPAVDGPWVVWTQEPQRGPQNAGLEVLVHDLRSWATRVERDLDATEVDVNDGTLYVAGPFGSERRDLFAMAADGAGPRRQLTHTGNVLDAEVAHGWAAWEQESRQLWAQPLEPPGEPVRVGGGVGLLLGDGFLLWSPGEGDLVLRGLDLSAPVRIATARFLPAWDAWGDRVAWVADPMDGAQSITLHVARVLRP